MGREVAAEHAEIFAALADETRLEVLLGIMERVAREGPVTYSEAMDAADLDDSGHFNYHLGELCEDMLYRVDDRYAPTTAAWELYMAIGTCRISDNDLDRRTEHLGVACLRCGEFLRAVYDYEFFVQCPDCERTVFRAAAGPHVGGEADLRSLARDLDDVDRRFTRLLVEGRCPDCAAPGQVWVGPTPEFVWLPTSIAVNVACSQCGNGYQFRSPGQYLLAHPDVREYADARGIDLHERPQWAYEWTRSDQWTVVQSEDPLRIEQHATIDGCRLVVEFEADGTVTHVDHVRLDGSDAQSADVVRADATTLDTAGIDRSSADE